VTEFEISGRPDWVADQLDVLVSPRKYHLHNRIGGVDWEVRPGFQTYGWTITQVRVSDPKLATYLILKLSK